jgi:hypothetical protein
VYNNPGNDFIRATADPVETGSGLDPRYESFTMRVLVRTAFTTLACFDKEYDNSYDLGDDSNCPPESNTDLVKRVIVQVRYPYTRVAGSALRTVQIMTLLTQPPSQIRASQIRDI